MKKSWGLLVLYWGLFLLVCSMNNFISSYDLDNLSQLVKKCDEILKKERSFRSKSLSYNDNTLRGMQYEQTSCPEKYYYFHHFDKHVTIVCDTREISLDGSFRRSRDNIFYHIVCSGFVPDTEHFHTRIDKMNLYKEVVVGNFINLDEALFCYKDMLGQVLKVVLTDKLCPHFVKNECEFFVW